jgi:hypothetical protein
LPSQVLCRYANAATFRNELKGISLRAHDGTLIPGSKLDTASALDNGLSMSGNIGVLFGIFALCRLIALVAWSSRGGTTDCDAWRCMCTVTLASTCTCDAVELTVLKLVFAWPPLLFQLWQAEEDMLEVSTAGFETCFGK